MLLLEGDLIFKTLVLYS